MVVQTIDIHGVAIFEPKRHPKLLAVDPFLSYHILITFWDDRA